MDRAKTFRGVRKGLKMFFGLLPDVLLVLSLVAVFLALVPDKTIAHWLGANSGMRGIAAAALLGSVSLIPGFIAFPLAAALHKGGVPLQVLAVFLTTLMMVGILTLPVERRFFGWKTAILRNALSFIGAIAVGFFMGFFL